MKMMDHDLRVLRELAKQYMEIAFSDRHVKMRKRFKATNDLRIVRPPLIMEEIPWHEFSIEEECVCHDDDLRKIEYRMRVQLYREKYFKCDNFIEPVWVVNKSYSSSGDGFEIDEHRVSVDRRNNIVSHQYMDVLEKEESLEKFHAPIITAHPDIDKRNKNTIEEVFGGIIPVEIRGEYVAFSPWDRISMLRGVEPILIDMYDRPEYLHKIVQLFADGMKAEMDQKDTLGLYDPNCISLHCTPGLITPKDQNESSCYTCKDVWFRTMAQMFSAVSPAAHDEFDIQYTIPLANRCAYTYYGCCEPLHDRIDKLKQYANLRKIGCSPWANIEKTAEAINGEYVLSRKPNPAHVAINTDPDVVRKEIEETVKVCIKYGCPCDITLKDISTVGYKPQNLIVWAETASKVLDDYYGAE